MALIRDVVVEKSVIDEVRRRFLEEYAANSGLYDELDVERMRTDEWTVKRFVAHKKGDVESSLQMLTSCLKWRKSFGVNQLKESDFPAEFSWIGECHTYCRDKNNVSTVYVRVKFHKPLPDWQLVIKKYLVYVIEQLEEDTRNGANGWAVIWDCEGGTLFNNNLELLSFLFNVFFEYYPLSLVYIGLYELPWVLRAIYMLVRSWLPEDYRRIITILTKSDIAGHIGVQHLPDYLNGTCAQKYRKKQTACPSLDQVADTNSMKSGSVKKFLAHYQKWINLADKEEGQK